MQKVYIVSVARTPLGSFGGQLMGFSATDLGAHAMKGALTKSGVAAEAVQEVFMGNVISANLGQAPARQAALAAGIGHDVPCTTVNKVCASGMKSVMFGAQAIMLGFADVVVAGGMESMSNIPYYMPKARFGYKYGGGELVDGLEKDGLRNVYDQKAMGDSADITATQYGISREQQDEYAIRSYKLSEAATNAGKFEAEIVPVEIPQRKGEPVIMKEDEEFKKVMFEKIPGLRPVFNRDGTVTAANASTINDGAAALVLCSGRKVKELGLKPIAEIISFADAAQDPKMFTTAPTLATPIALERGNLTIADIELFEVNEAFAVVPLAYNQVLNVDINKVNILGGAVSLGHPLGASGARIITTLTSALKSEGKEIGCAAICNGGGGASALVLRMV
jgi:acetyl-CoA C-acetyltransferase